MSNIKQLIKDIDSTRTEYLSKKEILNRLLEIDKINNIEVVEPTELRKEFENDIQVGDTVVVLDRGEHSGTIGIASEVDPDGFVLIRIKGHTQTFWETKINLKKL